MAPERYFYDFFKVLPLTTKSLKLENSKCNQQFALEIQTFWQENNLSMTYHS